MAITTLPGKPLMALCATFQEAAEALREDTPFYGAEVANDDLTDLYNRLVSIRDTGEVRNRKAEWTCHGIKPVLIGGNSSNVQKKTRTLIKRWKDMTSVLFPEHHYVSVEETQNRGDRPFEFHVDTGLGALFTTDPNTEIAVSRTYSCEGMFGGVVLDPTDILHTPEPGHALVLNYKCQPVPGGLAHRGRRTTGPRLMLLAVKSP